MEQLYLTDIDAKALLGPLGDWGGAVGKLTSQCTKRPAQVFAFTPDLALPGLDLAAGGTNASFDQQLQSLATFISDKGRDNAASTFILQHPLAAPGDGWIGHSAARISVIDSVVYSIVESELATQAYVCDAVVEFHTATLLFGLIGDITLPLDRSTSCWCEQVLSDVVKSVSWIVVSAFDGEGILLVKVRG